MGKPSFSLCVRIFFMAKMRLERTCRAWCTSPKVPSPSFFSSSYSPILEQPLSRRCSPLGGAAGTVVAMTGVRCDAYAYAKLRLWCW